MARQPSAVRIQTQRSGKVLCGLFAWDCVIRDLSSSGARVQMLASSAPPGQAQLVDLVAGLAHDVAVAWQRDREVGMRILKTYDLRGLTPAAAGASAFRSVVQGLLKPGEFYQNTSGAWVQK